MSDLSIIPLEDGFETQLAQDWDGAVGTVYVLDTPSYTPTTQNTYIVVNPGKTNMQIAEITDYDSTANTLTVSNVTLLKGLGINSTAPASSHATGSKVIISDNYQFWADIQTAINSKLDDTGGTMTGLLQFSGTTHAGIKLLSLTTVQRDALSASNGMIIYNSTTGELNQYIGGAWSAVASGSTQPTASTTVLGKIKTDVTPAGDPVALIQDNPKYDALAGTSGTPSGSNKYVTNDDTATAATADKVARRLAGGNITVVTETTGNNTTNASSTAFVQQEIAAAGIPSVNSIPNSILTSNSYFTQVLMPTVGTTADAISNGWTESNVIMTASQGGGGIVYYTITVNASSSIYTLLPGKGAQPYLRWSDIGANPITIKTRLYMATGPGATEAISWGLGGLTELEDSTAESIRFCIADNTGDKLYTVTADTTSPNTNNNVTGSLTIEDAWLNLAMVITSTQVLFYAGNNADLTLVATHTTDIPTSNNQVNIGWGVAANNTPQFYMSPIYISLPTT